MKKIILIAVTTLAIIILGAIGMVFYGVCIAPRLAAKHFVSLWTERLSPISDPASIPASWKDTVYLRKFNDGWILAAMYHGSCTEGSFNASVLRDSLGNITALPDWSPCAEDIESMGEFWERESPAASLVEFNSRLKNDLSKQK